MLGNKLSYSRSEEASLSYSFLVSHAYFNTEGRVQLTFSEYSKPYTCLAGFGDKIVVPKEVQEQVPASAKIQENPNNAVTSSSESDYEVELVIVIGKEGKNISKDKAFEHIVGVRRLL